MDMDYVQPIKLIAQLVVVGEKKSSLSVRDMLLRGFLSGVLLGFCDCTCVQGIRWIYGRRGCTGDGGHFPRRLRDDRTTRIGIGHWQLCAVTDECR